ncbi:MAG TPA: polysaccharide biosynthesis tyrosine autokinase [Opitutaceae bacterium]|nr:MAG: Tyrosine-protein kinase YwqD [Verrucomicrobia bacterium ADurb.Bin122]HOY53786.1 polysaccharide biosynthesis tyrosine autokinase [Opitutaceae bacterium]HPG17617.1 polysaccharide biosynthesis tyrosine autokinase [Opitutaceae bacterium]HPN99460.1 polysaccharide biosynthesis tyrosine autokinase [Opitutaceae bacterium]HQL20729.1 polysaccharide biosynthesis tyrosine autokinase [Opitutaceae bacterium]
MADVSAKSTHHSPGKDEEVVERRTLRDYLIILRERLWIALPIALLVAVGIGYYQSRATPLYQSRATLRFEKPDRIVATEGVTRPEVQSEFDINTYLEILKSDKLRQRVVNSLSPQEVKILQRPFLTKLSPGATPPSAGAALGSMVPSPVRNSFLISVSVNHQDPEAAALIANRYIDQFMQQIMDSTMGKNEYATDFLRKRSDDLRKESEAAALQVQRFMEVHKLVSLDESTNLVNARLQTVSTELTRVRLARLELESQVKQIETYQAEGRNLFEISSIATYDQIPALNAQIAELTRTQTVLGERYLERHPLMIELANKLRVAQEQLRTQVSLAIADLKSRLAKTADSERTFEQEKQLQETEFFKLRDLRGEYNSLKNQADVAQKNYIDILDRLNQTTTTKSLEKLPLQPLDRAVPAGAPFTPDLARIIRTSSLLFVALFLAVAIGLNFIDDRIKSTWDVEHYIGTTLLGIVPDLADTPDDDRYRMVLDHRQSPGLEAFLSIYSSVKIHSKLDFPKSILVTSTIPGEGKTLVSANLAASFARHGRRTLLIDCDLRRPMMHRHFKQSNQAGIITWFEKGADLSVEPQKNPDLGIISLGENLSLLCSGGRSKTPSSLLETPAFTQLLERLKQQYELVVVDSPPLGAVTDSLLLAERTDEIVYVCRFNKALRKHIQLYTKLLLSGKNEVLGIVLNGLSPRRIKYYSNYRYYRSYKKYYGTHG